MLIKMGKVRAEDVREVQEQFARLDVNGDGELTVEDLQLAVTRQAEGK